MLAVDSKSSASCKELTRCPSQPRHLDRDYNSYPSVYSIVLIFCQISSTCSNQPCICAPTRKSKEFAYCCRSRKRGRSDLPRYQPVCASLQYVLGRLQSFYLIFTGISLDVKMLASSTSTLSNNCARPKYTLARIYRVQSLCLISSRYANALLNFL